jgi:hypothetical protein
VTAAAAPVSPGLPGLGELEAAVMAVAWAADGDPLTAGEISRRLEDRRPGAGGAVEAAVGGLARSGYLQRVSCDGGWRYQAYRPLAGHLAQLISGLLARSPDRAATLAQAGITAGPADGPGGPAVSIVVCYDGCWFQNAARFLGHERGAPVSLAGLHDAIRWHAAALFGCPVRRVAITRAHYVAGRDPARQDGSFPPDEALADAGIIRHDMPVTAAKGEVGADVELALTCWEAACDTGPDLVVLLAGDGDFAPLAGRLAGRGLRVLVPRADFRWVAAGTSAWLTRRATDTPALADLLDAAQRSDYPPFLARPFPAGTAPARSLRHGTVTSWLPGAAYGFVSCDQGLTWFASSRETPGHAALPPGCQVTFTGDPSIPRGKSYPPACTLRPLPASHDPAETTDDQDSSRPLPDRRLPA